MIKEKWLSWEMGPFSASSVAYLDDYSIYYFHENDRYDVYDEYKATDILTNAKEKKTLECLRKIKPEHFL